MAVRNRLFAIWIQSLATTKHAELHSRLEGLCSWWLKIRVGGGGVYVSQIISRDLDRSCGWSFPSRVLDERSCASISQSWPTRGADCLRISLEESSCWQGHGCIPNDGKLSRIVARADVVRCGAAAGPLHQARRGGHSRSSSADQS